MKIRQSSAFFFGTDFNQSRPGTGHFVGRKEVSGNSKQFSWKVFMSSKPWSWKVYYFFEKSFGNKKLPRQVLPNHTGLKSEKQCNFQSRIVLLQRLNIMFFIKKKKFERRAQRKKYVDFSGNCATIALFFPFLAQYEWN